MQGFTSGQKRILADFFTTIAAGWFVAGVISSVFIRTSDLVGTLYNLAIGLLFTYFSIRIALNFAKKLK